MSEPTIDYYAATIEEADRLNSNLFLRDIRACARCDLHRWHPGWHLDNAFACPGWFLNLPLDILFVGMSPGREEDEVGRPFVGRAGRKLMELVDSVGLLDRQPSIGFSNIVRCHTPENRQPTGREIQACSTWMRCELDMAEPKVVVLLGNIAIGLAFPGYHISQVAGAARAIGQTIYVASYHPASVLHRRSQIVEESILSSLRLAREMIDF